MPLSKRSVEGSQMANAQYEKGKIILEHTKTQVKKAGSAYEKEMVISKNQSRLSSSIEQPICTL